MEDTKDNGIIEKEEEVIENIDPSKYKLVKKPSEKQVAARLAAGLRLKKIIEMKKADKEKIMKEHETKLVAELKNKWKKEYDDEKTVTAKNKNIAVPKNMIENKRKKRVVIRKPVKKEESDDESSATEDDHIPSDTEAETTDTRIIKKKLAKVKQIEQVVSKQAINPYLSLLEKYYKK